MKINRGFCLILGLVVFCGIVLPSYTGDGGRKDNNAHIKINVPKGWPKPTHDFEKKPVTTQGFELGRKLFFDPVLSGDSTISCASCHLPYTNFTHVDHALSHGIGGLKGTRNTLSIINVAWNKSFMWDGGINNIEVQPLAPIESKVEMHSSLSIILPRLKRSTWYREKFKMAFGEKTEITGQLFLKALSQYMLALQSSNSKYDKVMRNEKGIAFSETEARGLELFRKNCSSCHTEPLFTNHAFENNGLEPDSYLKDGGRIKITHKESDSLKFRVPSLRNIELSYPYMHDGRYRNLQMVLFHYSDDIHQTVNLSDKLKKPLKFTEQQKNDIIAFLKTLTDMDFLRNPEYTYKPETTK
ncbi:MAG TPA: cytochrome c peroxidase [Flavobacteriales bacterium]|nr:cytochrome c peroxidase [Flavobacteriales bacterium]